MQMMPTAFVPGDSLVHRLNPIVKIVWILGLVVLAFSSRNVVLLYGVAVFALAAGALARVLPQLVRAALIIIPIGSSLIFLQSIAPAQAGLPVLVSVGPISIYQQGIYNGLVLLGRIVAVLLFALVVVMSTHPSDMFVSFAKLRMPYTVNFMLAMTLQLIPILQRELRTTMSAQRSRGMAARGFAAVLPSFVPVFMGAIDRVQQLAISLESRGFGSTGAKTSFRQVRGGVGDWVVGGLGAAAIAALVFESLSRHGWDVSAQVRFSPMAGASLVLAAAVVFVSIVLVSLFFMVRR